MKVPSFIFAGILAASVVAAETFDLRLMSYNIRYATTNLEAHEKPWAGRRPLMANQLKQLTDGRPASLVCMQEALYQQAEDLRTNLGRKRWRYIGVGRDDGAKAGEMSPIFYQPSIWHLVNHKTYWLSQTPNKPGSKGWDASLPRIVTVGKFEHVKTGTDFVFMCAHFDYRGLIAQAQSSELIVKLTKDWADGSTPVFVGGDLNATPDSKAYQILHDKLNDVKSVIPQDRQYGFKKSYTGFTDDISDNLLLDYFFVKDRKSVEWVSTTVPNNRAPDGTYISDHRPLILDVKVPFKRQGTAESSETIEDVKDETRLELIKGKSRLFVALQNE